MVTKSLTATDSFMSPSDLKTAFVEAYKHNGWKTGMAEWQYKDDADSAKIKEAISGLIG